MARYLVSGAAGFIGSNVAGQLLGEGHQVVGIDNLNDAYDVRLKQWRLRPLQEHPSFHFHQLDITDRAALSEISPEPRFDGVLNLAARAGVRPSVTDPWIYAKTNIHGTLNLLEMARLRGISKFVQASTSSLYGLHNSKPFREDADISRPLSPYAATKGAAEMLCHNYHFLHGLDVTILRYFTVYGPAGRPDMSIFRFVQWIAEGQPLRLYGDGRQERDYTYVEDIARGTLAALKPLGYEVINLGGDRPIAIMDVIHMIEELVGKPAQVERHDALPADMPATWADISKAHQLLGWQPEVDLLLGLQAAVAWYLAERDWARDVPTSDE